MPDCETQALIAELEKAEEGSRALDARIGVLHYDATGAHPVLSNGDFLLELGKSGEESVRCPHYTTSIDAALTLFDEGERAEALYAAVRLTPLTIRGAKRFPIALVGLRLARLRAREAGEHQTIAEMTAVSPEEMNRPVTNFNASRRKP